MESDDLVRRCLHESPETTPEKRCSWVVSVHLFSSKSLPTGEIIPGERGKMRGSNASTPPAHPTLSLTHTQTHTHTTLSLSAFFGTIIFSMKDSFWMGQLWWDEVLCCSAQRQCRPEAPILPHATHFKQAVRHTALLSAEHSLQCTLQFHVRQ